MGRIGVFSLRNSIICAVDFLYRREAHVVWECVYPALASGTIKAMKIFVTGGAGYIGSITNKLLVEQGHDTIVFDNLSRGHREAVGKTPLLVGDLTNLSEINEVFEQHDFDAVIHFAALSLAGESMEKPNEYFHNNLFGGLNLLETMQKHNCKKIIFSSTSAVYGYPKRVPIVEEEAIAPVSVYGASKHMVEEMIGWYEKIYGIKSVILRYFNAAGAMLDGSLGEDHESESHIIPVAIAVALGKQKTFELFGDDYETTDGTCIRDYIHVVDLADAHIKALELPSSEIINLGVGRGYSNKEVLAVVSKITGRKLPVEVKPRRLGDPAKLWADNAKAKRVLSWEPKYSDIETIVSSALKWHKKN